MRKQVSFTLPKSWEDVTLKQYTAYLKATKPYLGTEEYDLMCFEKAINHFCDLSTEDLRSLPVENYNGLYDTVNSLFKKGYELPLVHRFKILSTEYGFLPSLNDMSYGEYLDLSTYFKEMWDNMPSIMAILYRPITNLSNNTYSISTYQGTNPNTEELFKERLTMDIVWGAIGFFQNLQRDLANVTLISLSKEVKKMKTDTALLEILTKNGVDISQFQSLLEETSQSLTK